MLTRAAREEELRAILQGTLVREGSHSYALLSFLAGRALNGATESLKEYTIGVEVFGKPVDYDPRLDATVRVEIGRLRTRLNNYYNSEGAGREIRISIPKGSYSVEFLPNLASRAPVPEAASGAEAPGALPPEMLAVTPAPDPGTQPTAAGDRAFLRSRWLWGVLVALVAVAGGSLALVNRNGSNEGIERFWAPQLSRRLPTLLVYGTPIFLKVDGAYVRDPHGNSPDELSRSPVLEGIIGALKPSEVRPVYHFTGFGELEAAVRITKLLASRGVPVTLRRSKDVSWEDLKRDHVILLGGAKFNRQILDLPYRSKFESRSRRIVNRYPEKNEPAAYATTSDTPHGAITSEYALISSYPGLAPGSRLVVLDSSSSEGTNLASEYVTRPDRMAELWQRMQPPDDAAYQIVVKGRFRDGVPITVEYVSHAVLRNSGPM
ncbi:MAG: hypothetical protein JNL98_02525 [Bryobacterales bacterium]|nr:hypothetical protein [Bryobacterales bacterium]